MASSLGHSSREPWSRGSGGLAPSAPAQRVPPSQGNPKPQVLWTHNGRALDSQRVSVRTGDQDSILFIRSAQRSDSGCYELTVQLKGLEAKAAVNVLVIGMGPGETRAELPPAPGLMVKGVRPRESDRSPIVLGVGLPRAQPSSSLSGPAEKPGPPRSIRLLDVWSCNAALEWTPPQDTGNTELLGYTVQKADQKTGVRPAGAGRRPRGAQGG